MLRRLHRVAPSVRSLSIHTRLQQIPNLSTHGRTFGTGSSAIVTPVWTTDCFLPVCAAEQLFISMHSHLPWWAAIGASAFAIRTVFTLPIAVWQARMRSRMLSLAPHMRSLAVAVRSSIMRSGKFASEEEAHAAFAAEYGRSVKKMHHEHSVRPFLSTFKLRCWSHSGV
jgi:membrane protein insertase Oxa1/YidC/SpoIIIJ